MRRARIDERLHVRECVEEEVRRDLRLQQMQSRVERLALELTATIALRGEGFIQRVTSRRDADLWQVTRANRDGLPAQALAYLKGRASR